MYAIWVCFHFIVVTSANAQQTSDFFDAQSIQEVNLSFEQENWMTILDSLRYNGEKMLIGKVNINGTSFDDVGVRYAATRGFQLGNKRNSIELDLDFIKKGQQYKGQDFIKLSISLRDPSFVREVLGYEIARTYMPAPKANYAKLTINDEYIGFYLNVEPIDVNFLKAHYEVGLNGGNLYFSYPDYTEGKGIDGCKANAFGSLQAEPNETCLDYNFKDLSGNGYKPLLNLANKLNDPNADLSKILDVDQVLWMHAFNNLIVNLYSYTGKYNQNYYLFQDENGVFHPVLGDLNLAFGGFKNDGNEELKLKELQELDPFLQEDDPNFPLISVLLSDNMNKKRYLSHFKTIYEDFFTNDAYLTRANELQSTIRDLFVNDPNQSYTAENFDESLSQTIGARSKIPGIEELMSKRVNYLRKNRDLRILGPSIENVTVTQREQFASTKLNKFQIQATIDKFPEQVTLFYRAPGDKKFKSIMMVDDGQHEDGKADDGVFGAIIQAQREGIKAIEYYIQAENLKAVSFKPRNYVYDLMTVTLEDINR